MSPTAAIIVYILIFVLIFGSGAAAIIRKWLNKRR